MRWSRLKCNRSERCTLMMHSLRFTRTIDNLFHSSRFSLSPCPSLLASQLHRIEWRCHRTCYVVYIRALQSCITLRAHLTRADPWTMIEIGMAWNATTTTTTSTGDGKEAMRRRKQNRFSPFLTFMRFLCFLYECVCECCIFIAVAIVLWPSRK